VSGRAVGSSTPDAAHSAPRCSLRIRRLTATPCLQVGYNLRNALAYPEAPGFVHWSLGRTALQHTFLARLIDWINYG
jgi:hypothetical protein